MRIPIVRATLLFISFIFGGLLLFVFDFYELNSPEVNTMLLLLLMLAKVAYFISATLRWIRKTVVSTYHLVHLTSFLGLHVLLIVLSFAIDYYCLYRIYPTSFSLPFGQQAPWEQMLTFLYFSLGKFTTAGGGEMHPASAVAQGCVMAEMIVSYFTTVLVIANVGHLQGLFGNKSDAP
ncbi:MAG: ion channel [Janthinobacterium lividum]